MKQSYTEEDIKTFGQFAHIRERPVLYIGDFGDGSFEFTGTGNLW